MKKNIPIVLFVLFCILLNIGLYSLIINNRIKNSLTYQKVSIEKELTRSEIPTNVIVVPNRKYIQLTEINREYIVNYPFPKRMDDTTAIKIISEEV